MLSTGEIPLWLAYFSLGLLSFTTCVALFSLYYARRVLTEYPTKTLLYKLRAEIDSLSGDFADLTARFARFQKRQDMQAARETKRSNASLQEEAATILQTGSQASSPVSNKRDLYAKIRGH